MNNNHYYTRSAYNSQDYIERDPENPERWKPHRLNGHGLVWGTYFGAPQIVSSYKPSVNRRMVAKFDQEDFQTKSQMHDYTDSTETEPLHTTFHHDHMSFVSKQSAGMIFGYI